jgi:hypothetical protein
MFERSWANTVLAQAHKKSRESTRRDIAISFSSLNSECA